MFTDIDVLVAPTVAVTAPRVGHTAVEWESSEVDVMAMLVRLARAANASGAIGRTSPLGATRTGSR